MTTVEKIQKENSAVKVLLNLLRIADEASYMHSLSVASIVEEMIRLMPKNPWSETETEEIIAGALLHDIGKAFIPFQIQSGSQNLDFNRKIMIQSHTNIGYEMVRDCFPEIVEEIVLLHHQRADGSGYPYIPEVGIFDEDNIPDYVTLVSYADVLDALITDKPYRGAVPLTEALEIMINEIDKRMLSYKFKSLLVEYVNKNKILE